MITSRTSLILGFPKQTIICSPPDPTYYRCRNCDTNLTSNTPQNKYQIQKQIQKTVRVSSSEYLMNKASLNAYRSPLLETKVNWNQQSDRPIPSVSKSTIPTGYHTTLNNRHFSQTSSRPGCQTPGGIGCDIKHNSYQRYLLRLKGIKPLRRGIIPPTFFVPNLPFQRSSPMYGDKQLKTSIVSGCSCFPNNDSTLFSFPNGNDVLNNAPPFTFAVGMKVYAIENPSLKKYTQGIILESLDNNSFLVQFNKTGSTQWFPPSELFPSYQCNTPPPLNLYDRLILSTNGTEDLKLELNAICQLKYTISNQPYF